MGERKGEVVGKERARGGGGRNLIDALLLVEVRLAKHAQKSGEHSQTSVPYCIHQVFSLVS